MSKFSVHVPLYHNFPNKKIGKVLLITVELRIIQLHVPPLPKQYVRHSKNKSVLGRVCNRHI